MEARNRMLTKQEAENTLAFLSRVNLTGSEAIELVRIQQKLGKYINEIKEIPQTVVVDSENKPEGTGESEKT